MQRDCWCFVSSAIQTILINFLSNFDRVILLFFMCNFASNANINVQNYEISKD